ncbi:MAG: hypothetical protein ACON5J_17275, partial [Rubripirellula sp.]
MSLKFASAENGIGASRERIDGDYAHIIPTQQQDSWMISYRRKSPEDAIRDRGRNQKVIRSFFNRYSGYLQ